MKILDKIFVKGRIACLCLYLLVILMNILGLVEVVGSQVFQPPASTTWFTFGNMGNQGTRTSRDANFALSAPTAAVNRGSTYGRSSCQEMGIPCSGHTVQSCGSYCRSVGYTYSTCDGTCCLCSNTQDGMSDYMTTLQWNQKQDQFPPLLTKNGQNDNIIKTTQRSPRSLFLNEQDEDLDAQQSSNQIYQQWAQNYFKGYQYKNENADKNSKNSNNFKGVSNKKIPKFDQDTSNPNSVQVNRNGPEVCQTEACRTASQQLQSNMNRRANPCDNFYEFACGGFVKNTQIPHDKTEITPFSLLRDKVSEQLRTLFEEPLSSRDPHPFRLAKTMYQNCMNTDLIEQLGTEPLKEVLVILGGWPVLEGNRWQPEYYTWANFVVWFREVGFPTDYFIKMSVEPDIKNVRRKLITLGEPLLGLEREVLIRGANEPAVNAYYNYMVEMAVLMGASRETAKIEMLQALNFEVEIAKSFYRPNNSRGSSYYSPITLAELELKFPSVPWLELAQRILPKKVIINSQEVVMVSAPHYLDAFFDLLARTDIRVQSNYAIWRAVSSSVSYLNKAARRLQFDFSASITGQRIRIPRWKECSQTVSASLANAAGAMYTRRFFSKEAKNQAYDMILNIQQAFLGILNEIDWMDEMTRMKAKEKAANVKIHVGYPEEHLSDAKITALYSEYDFKPNDYFGNIRNLVISATNLAFESLKAPVNKNDWVVHGKTSIVNAFYLPLENAIQFPAAILQNPFFDSSRPKYMNYGSIGWITGHELSHGFDDQGHQFDKDGNYANWWDPFTKNTYTTKTQCIINQYGSYVPTGSEIKINGVKSQGENVADNGGIKQAYRGYQSWVGRNGAEKTLPGFEDFSTNQLFWMSAANNWCSVYRAESLRHQILSGVHAPGEFRVRGTFANNEDFSRDFSCPVTSRMNPINKCSVW